MHQLYVSRRIKNYIIFCPITIGSILLIPTILTENYPFGIFLSITIALFIFGFVFICYNKAFMKVTITNEGIGTKHLFLTWEEIDKCGEYDVYDLEEYKLKKRLTYGIIKFPLILGIGNTEGKNFLLASRNEIVYFAVDKETFAALEECGRGKSKIIDEILDRFSVLLISNNRA